MRGSKVYISKRRSRGVGGLRAIMTADGKIICAAPGIRRANATLPPWRAGPSSNEKDTQYCMTGDKGTLHFKHTQTLLAARFSIKVHMQS